MRVNEAAGGLRYFAIADEIRRRIVSGHYSFGTALPSQSALAKEFATTVMTVRQALKTLESEGLLEMRHGIGSFVTGLNEDHREFTLSSFRQTVGTQAEAIATEVVFRNRTTSNATAAAALEIGDRSVSSIGRKRSLRSRVLVFQISFVPEEYADVLYAYEPGSSLYTSLNGYLDTVVTQAEERISAIAAPESVASYLEVATGTPCLFSQRVSKDIAGKPVLFDQAYMRSDGVELSLYRNGKSAYSTYLIHDKEDA